MRRALGRVLLKLATWYVVLNLLAANLIDIVVTGRIACRVVDAATGLPLRDAMVCNDHWSRMQRTDADGAAELEITTAPGVSWVLPLIGSFHLGGHLHVTADGYRAVDAALPEYFDWPLFGEPHAELTVRMQR